MSQIGVGARVPRLPSARRGDIIVARESNGTPVRKPSFCRFCVVEMARIALADGTAALVCLDCDAIGLEHEIAGGGPMSPAGLAAVAKAGKTRRPRLRPRRGGAAHG